MSSPLFALCLALCLHVGVAQLDDYETFPSYPDSRYKVSSDRVVWADALAVCQSDGGTLAVINSDVEAEVVTALVERLVDTGSPFPWVGINDIETEGEWVTVQGGLVSESGYNGWGFNKPSGGTIRNCGFVWTDGLFYDWDCAEVEYFICEKSNL